MMRTEHEIREKLEELNDIMYDADGVEKIWDIERAEHQVAALEWVLEEQESGSLGRSD